MKRQDSNPTPPPPRTCLLHRLFLVLFLLSGAAGLMYEVLWVRQFTQLLGASTYAITVVLTTFMFGLGAGAWAIGKLADRIGEKQLLTAYVAIEAGIGLYALAFPWIIRWAEAGYVGIYQAHLPDPVSVKVVKLLFAFALLALPTVLIGATLPVLSRYVIRDRRGIAVTVSQLYATNTIGAILGAVTAGYFLLPSVGMKLTNLTAVALSFTVAAAAGLVKALSGVVSDGDGRRRAVRVDPGREPATALQKAVIAGFGLSGAVSMFYEVAWTRTLSMILGTTTYAFTTMLAAFLLGIALGSLLYRFIPASVSRLRLFSILQGVLGFSVLLTIPAFEKLPFLFLTAHLRWVDSWANLQFVRFLLALFVMIVPCLSMGVLFPVVSGIFIRRTGHIGSRLGTVYGWNTFGASLGAALAGLVLVPAVGMQKTILIGGALNLATGLAVLWLQADVSPRRRTAISAAAAAAAAAMVLNIAPWAPRIMSSGPYVYASRYEAALDRYRGAAHRSEALPEVSEWGLWELAMKQFQLLYYEPGVTATVAVMERDDGVRFLTINGKTDASTGEKSDLRTQTMIAQLPLLFHEDPDEVLVVGLGSGITVGSVLTHDVRVVDCAEISPAVIEAARYFSEANYGALSDKRLRIIPQDARNLLLVSDKQYDVVISQPSNPWISGESSLFSLEWYRLVRERLESGGLFLQWIPAYLMDERDLKVIVHTVRSVFPNLTLWSSGSAGDLILLAEKGGRLRVDYERFSRCVAQPRVWKDIRRTGLDPMLLPFRLFVMNEQKLSTYLYADLKRPILKNTDDRLVTEFSTPKRMVRHQKVARFLAPEGAHGDVRDVMGMMDHVDRERLQRALNRHIDTHREGVETAPTDQGKEV